VLSGLTLKAIRDVRTELAMRHADLLRIPYQPTEPVYRLIADGAAWMSVRAFFVTGPSPDAGIGPSAEARYLFNPYLLLGAEFWSWSIWDAPAPQWSDAVKRAPTAKEIPLYPPLKSLIWEPSQRRATATYDLTEFRERAKEHLKPLPELPVFGTTAYNARDFGIRFLQLNEARSVNIKNPKYSGPPIALRDHLADRGSLCGVTEGCNHRDGMSPEHDSIQIVGLPAEAAFDLWQYRPTERTISTPFLTFVLRFI
jgi:hypothetical protein